MHISASKIDYKDVFGAWLIKRGVRKAYLVIRALLSLSRAYGVEFDFCLFTSEGKKELQKKLFRSSPFRDAPNSERKAVLEAMDLYCRFCMEERPANHSEEIKMSYAHSPRITLSEDKENQEGGSSDLELLLKDEMFCVLRNKLKSDGKKTVDDLRQISLLPYMNENHLYSYRRRLEILDEVTALLRGKTPDGLVNPRVVSQESETVSRNHPCFHDGEKGKNKHPVNLVPPRPTYENNVSSIIKGFGIKGGAIEEVQNAARVSRYKILGQIEKDNDIIEIAKDLYVHKESLIDVEEMADGMLTALEKIFERFGGYSSDQLFYDEIRLPLALPLNDNDFDSCAAVFALARHFFSKEQYRGRSFIFFNGMHIWEEEPAYPQTMKGLAIHNARRVSGLVNYDDMAAFFQDLRFNVTNLKQVMGIGVDYTFLQYDENAVISGELLVADGDWIKKVSSSLDYLFAENEFVVIRDINREWYSLLPELPFGLGWSPLLLQEVMGAYQDDVGYRTIPALSGQRTDTIHAAIVPLKSSIKNFADFSAALFHQLGFSNRRMSSEELRSVLKEKGVLVGGELVGSLHRALDDYRFAWSIDKKTVLLNAGA